MVLEDYLGITEVLVQLLYTVVTFLLHRFCETFVLLPVSKVQDCLQ